MDSLVVLPCDVINLPQPRPLRTWYKDGNLVYSEPSGDPVDNDEYSMENEILIPGVLEPATYSLFSDGSIRYNYAVQNISVPQFLPANITTIEQARDEVFDLLLGNWTCAVNNSLGAPPPITYLIRECGKTVNSVGVIIMITIGRHASDA